MELLINLVRTKDEPENESVLLVHTRNAVVLTQMILDTANTSEVHFAGIENGDSFEVHAYDAKPSTQEPASVIDTPISTTDNSGNGSVGATETIQTETVGDNKPVDAPVGTGENTSA